MTILQISGMPIPYSQTVEASMDMALQRPLPSIRCGNRPSRSQLGVYCVLGAIGAAIASWAVWTIPPSSVHLLPTSKTLLPK